MAQQTREVLKDYFKTGDKPTQGNFEDLIDSFPLVGEVQSKENTVDLDTEQTITAEKTFSGGINMNNTRIHKVKIPAMYDDAANKQYVDSTVSLANNAVQTTWSELKSLRDAGKLVPGTQYRITDYTCTTTQSGTKSAGHVFDIVVTADDESTLNEVARAVKHDGDTYFANSDLNAWQIWYCLDNDTTRFNWADRTNGKGVIYRMIDEWNNDVPYDFKNIQFKHPKDTTTYPYYYYTFASGKAEDNTDCSLNISNYYCYSNTIREYISKKKRKLNSIIFIGYSCHNNSFGNNCYSNTFGTNYNSYCYSNTFGNECNNNTFGNDCDSNSFGNDCNNNTFGNDCDSNSFGNDCDSNSFKYACRNNTFENGCQYNTFGGNCSGNFFGNSCQNNKFGDNCSSNSFGNDCNSNSFGNDCRYNAFRNNCQSNVFGNSCASNAFGNDYNNNVFGNRCYSNAFGNYCYSNSFVNDCYSNSFGNDCYSNSFGNNCYSNAFGNNCNNINFASDSSASTKYNFYQHNHFGDGCQYIVFTGAASNSQQVQNYSFAQGLQGTDSAYLTIEGVRNRSFETKVAKNSNGEVKVYCEADLIL